MKKASITEAKNKLLERLVRAGIVRPARAAFPRSRIASEPPRAAKACGVQALLEHRRAGR